MKTVIKVSIFKNFGQFYTNVSKVLRINAIYYYKPLSRVQPPVVLIYV